MDPDLERRDDELEEESYASASGAAPPKVFDAKVLRETVMILPARSPLIFAGSQPVSDAMRAMQRRHRGCVLVTEDGTANTRLAGIFTERDVLFRIIDKGRNPATLPIEDVMTAEPEALPAEASIAWALNKMSVGGFRHVPVVDAQGRPVFVASVRDVVEFLVQSFPREVLNLPTEYGADRTRTREGA